MGESKDVDEIYLSQPSLVGDDCNEVKACECVC
jgi:hypothetical protein